MNYTFNEPELVVSRRRFLKTTALASSLPLLSTAAFSSIFSDERTAWYRDAKF